MMTEYETGGNKYSKVCAECQGNSEGSILDKIYDKLCMFCIYLLCNFSNIVHRIWPRMKDKRKKPVLSKYLPI